MSITKLSQPVSDFMVARMFGARSALTFAENAVARVRSEDGGIGMQAAIIAGGLVVVAVGVTLILRNQAGEIEDDLSNIVNNVTINTGTSL